MKRQELATQIKAMLEETDTIHNWDLSWDQESALKHFIKEYYKVTLDQECSYFEITSIDKDAAYGEGEYQHCSVCDTEYYGYSMPLQYLTDPDGAKESFKRAQIAEAIKYAQYELAEAKKSSEYYTKRISELEERLECLGAP